MTELETAYAQKACQLKHAIKTKIARTAELFILKDFL